MGISHNFKTTIGTSVNVLARISDPFNNYSPLLLTSTTQGQTTTYNITSITYDAYYKGSDGWEQVSGYTNVTVPVTALKTAVVKGGSWTCDDTGYNFETTLSGLFNNIGEYSVKFIITPSDETVNPVVFNQNIIIEE